MLQLTCGFSWLNKSWPVLVSLPKTGIAHKPMRMEVPTNACTFCPHGIFCTVMCRLLFEWETKWCKNEEDNFATAELTDLLDHNRWGLKWLVDWLCGGRLLIEKYGVVVMIVVCKLVVDDGGDSAMNSYVDHSTCPRGQFSKKLRWHRTSISFTLTVVR